MYNFRAPIESEDLNRDGKSLQNSKHKSFKSEKLAHKIFAKKTQNRAKLAKMPKIAEKRQKPLTKCVKKTKKIAQL